MFNKVRPSEKITLTWLEEKHHTSLFIQILVEAQLQTQKLFIVSVKFNIDD
jgi:uncharacterized protein YndB with AHSA1/START domain